jgi:conjugal transfer pilus assembly protein TraB
MSESSLIQDESNKKRRTVLVVFVVSVLVVIVGYFLYRSQQQFIPPAPVPTINLKGKTDTSKEVWQIQSGKEILEMREEIKKLKEPKAAAPAQDPRLPQSGGLLVPPPPPMGAPSAYQHNLIPAPPGSPGAPVQPVHEDVVLTNLISIKQGKPSSAKTEKPKEKPADGAAPSGKGSKSHIAAGSFVKATLLNGVDAPTGSKGKGSPYPVLLKIVDLAQLPNFFKSDIRDCFALGEAYGELSNERVQIRVTKLSCVSKEGRELESKVSGYAVGEDGKLGLSARIVSKQGALIGRALIAGLVSGAGGAMQQAAYTQSQSLTGLPVNTIDPSKVAQAAIGSGLAKGADELSKFYIENAKELFPVAEVNSGRLCEIVFLERATLSEVK